MIGVQIVRSLTKIFKKVPLAIYLEGTFVVIFPNAIFGVWLPTRQPKGFSQMEKVS